MPTRVFQIILHLLVKTQGSAVFELVIFHLIQIFFKNEFQKKVNYNCCRRPVKGEEINCSPKIVATMPTAASSNLGFAATITIATATTIDQSYMIFIVVDKKDWLMIYMNWLIEWKNWLIYPQKNWKTFFDFLSPRWEIKVLHFRQSPLAETSGVFRAAWDPPFFLCF